MHVSGASRVGGAIQVLLPILIRYGSLKLVRSWDTVSFAGPGMIEIEDLWFRE